MWLTRESLRQPFALYHLHDWLALLSEMISPRSSALIDDSSETGIAFAWRAFVCGFGALVNCAPQLQDAHLILFEPDAPWQDLQLLSSAQFVKVGHHFRERPQIFGARALCNPALSEPDAPWQDQMHLLHMRAHR